MTPAPSIRQIVQYLLLALPLTAAAQLAVAQESAAQSLERCADVPEVNSRSRQTFEAEAFLILAATQESGGRSNFRLTYEEPLSECIIDTFELPETTVMAVYSPWQKGPQTIHYRFVADGEVNQREVLVLYSGIVGLVMNGGEYFYVAEQRDGVIAYYAMFKERPTYEAAKEVVTGVLNDKLAPLLATDWPEGSPESQAISFDAERLK